MKITYYGHSCFLVEHGGHRVIIDPFLSGNPGSGLDPAAVKVDAVLLTHGHGDHFGDTIPIAKANDCPVIATFELASFCQSKGTEAHMMNMGGTYEYKGFRIKLTPAWHSSSVQDGDRLVYAGMPAGILLSAGGKTFYHSGDTALFSDLKLIGEMNRIDVAALPIGDNFTMGPDEAVIAAKWVKAPRVIPVHYDTFPVIRQDAQRFADMLGESGIEGLPLKSGESIEV